LSKFTNVKILLDVPEEKLPREIVQQIVIGTPGRIKNATEKRTLNTSQLKMLVLDEADAMLDLQGQRDQAIRVRKKIPRDCQICLFSATYNVEVKRFAQEFVPQPRIGIFIEPEKLSLDKLVQTFVDCGAAENRLQILNEIFAFVSVGQSIIFTHRRDTAKRVYNFMKSQGHEVSLLHGSDMPPKTRDRVIDKFRIGENRTLITTNVLARGIDVLQVSLVINFDVPITQTGQLDPETYLHRIGRTARYNNPGLAVNFVYDVYTKNNLKAIEQHFKKTIRELDKTRLEEIGEILDKMTSYVKYDPPKK